MSMKRSGLPELVRGPFENRTEVLRALQADPEAFDGYAGLGRELQENFMQFCLGEQISPVTRCLKRCLIRRHIRNGWRIF